jgi:hypothetical protein
MGQEGKGRDAEALHREADFHLIFYFTYFVTTTRVAVTILCGCCKNCEYIL